MPAPAGRALRLRCWEGYQHADVVGPFANRHRVAVEADTLISDADTAAHLIANPTGCDVLNINNAYVSKVLHPAGCIAPLEPARFEPFFERMLPQPQFERLYRWARSEDGSELLGLCQRFGAFNFVINSALVSRSLAEDEGFALATDNRLPFGVLLYEDFNIFHVCIGAGLNPFEALNHDDEEAFEGVARSWFERAALVSDDHHALNRALIDRRIAFYISGGVYTASPARLAGHLEIEAVTPLRGPIHGRGGIVFTEITSLVAHPDLHPAAPVFLEYLMEPDTAIRIALSDGTCNPVAQMGDPRVMQAFTRAQLEAIQWDALEADIARCADYDIVPNHANLLTRLRSAVAARSH